MYTYTFIYIYVQRAFAFVYFDKPHLYSLLVLRAQFRVVCFVLCVCESVAFVIIAFDDGAFISVNDFVYKIIHKLTMYSQRKKIKQKTFKFLV